MKNLYILIFTVVFLVSFQTDLIAQNKFKAGLSASITATGSGHGLLYNPGVFVQYRRTMGIMEMNYQNLDHLAGFQLTLRRNIILDGESYGGRSTLFAYSSTIIQNSARLNSTLSERYAAMNTEIVRTDVSFKTIEQYVGFGMNTRISSLVSWYGNIGFGFYITPESGDQSDIPAEFGRFRNSNDFSLQLKTGLQFNLASLKGNHQVLSARK